MDRMCKFCEQKSDERLFVGRRCRKCYNEYQKEWRKQNKERCNASQLKWCKNNPEKHAKNQWRWRDRNRDKWNAYMREYFRKRSENKQTPA